MREIAFLVDDKILFPLGNEIAERSNFYSGTAIIAFLAWLFKGFKGNDGQVFGLSVD